MRSTMLAIPLLAACTGTQDSGVQYCNEACGDFWTVRALDSVHTKVWASALADTAPNVNGVATYDAVAIPCSEGSMTASGTATVETNGSVTLDLTITHAGCKQSDPQQAKGYTITTTGSVAWAGNFSEGGARSLTYQSSELTISGDVYQQTVPTSIDETCTLQVTLSSKTTDDFAFAGAWCGRDIVDPSL